MPCVGSRRGIILKLHYKKLSNIFTTSQEGYVLLELKNNWEKWTHLARNFLTRIMNLIRMKKKICWELFILIQGSIQVWMVGPKKV